MDPLGFPQTLDHTTCSEESLAWVPSLPYFLLTPLPFWKRLYQLAPSLSTPIEDFSPLIRNWSDICLSIEAAAFFLLRASSSLSWHQPSLGINPLWATNLFGSQPCLGNIPPLALTLSGHQPFLGNNPFWVSTLFGQHSSHGINPLWASILPGQQSSRGLNSLWASFISLHQSSLGINPPWITIISGYQLS